MAIKHTLQRRILLACSLALASLGFAAGASAVGIVTGGVAGPPDGFTIDMSFNNDPLSTLDVVSITLDGSTSLTEPIIWDSAGTPVAPPGASILIGGEDSTLLTITFGDDLDGFNPGETFALNTMDPDFASALSLTVSDLEGVMAVFTFRDASTFQGILGFETGDDGGQHLNFVPEPSTALLLLTGLIGLGVAGRRR